MAWKDTRHWWENSADTWKINEVSSGLYDMLYIIGGSKKGKNQQCGTVH